MKMRFNINPPKFIPRQEIPYIQTQFLMKHIMYVVINGEKYMKPSQPNDIQVFYMMISDNRECVTEVLMGDGCHIFLKNCNIHSYGGYCYSHTTHNTHYITIKHYAKNGIILNEEEIKIFERGVKIKTIKNKINDTSK